MKAMLIGSSLEGRPMKEEGRQTAVSSSESLDSDGDLRGSDCSESAAFIERSNLILPSLKVAPADVSSIPIGGVSRAVLGDAVLRLLLLLATAVLHP